MESVFPEVRIGRGLPSCSACFLCSIGVGPAGPSPSAAIFQDDHLVVHFFRPLTPRDAELHDHRAAILPGPDGKGDARSSSPVVALSTVHLDAFPWLSGENDRCRCFGGDVCLHGFWAVLRSIIGEATRGWCTSAHLLEGMCSFSLPSRSAKREFHNACYPCLFQPRGGRLTGAGEYRCTYTLRQRVWARPRSTSTAMYCQTGRLL